MQHKATSVLLLLVTASFAIGCAGLRDGIVDSAAGFPASDLAKDVKRTSDEYNQQRRDENAEELSREYEEFLRSQEGDTDDEPPRSVVITKDDDLH